MPTKNSTIPLNPLGKIALCLSGGGYRAASFQLGTMSYLNGKTLHDDKTLLQNVKALSTVSGGTITGIYYALRVQQRGSFETIFKELMDWLSNTDLVKESLKKINENGVWKHDYKRKNLVNAFSELYDETLLKGATIADLKALKNSHLEFVCFNSTEFNRGLRYRFQTGKGRIFFGSDGLQLGKDFYNEFRLGDVIAASSAFSGGFEPIAMPNDFLHPESEAFEKIKLRKEYKEPVGLMDGGIYDNQGISGIEDYEDNKGVTPFDLIMISDVSSPYISDFDFSSEQKGKFRDSTLNEIGREIKNFKLNIYAFIILLFLIGLMVIASVKLTPSTALGVGISLITMASILAIVTYYLSGLFSKKFDSTKNYLTALIPEYFRERLSSFDFLNTKIGRLELLFLDRINSLKLLLPGIFLKQIRRLHYQRLYENERFDNRRVSCLVKQLTKDDFDYKRSKGLDDLDFLSKYIPDFDGKTFDQIVGKNIPKYSEKAADFGTTLWFTDEDKIEEQLKCLIISGQISCCQSLLIYLTKLVHHSEFELLNESVKAPLQELLGRVLKDWREFKANPSFQFDNLMAEQ